MEVKAQLKNFRMAPRKVRLVSGLLKGTDALAARAQLDYLVKKSARPMAKLLESAMANAHNNLGMVKENLFIKNIIVNEGAKLKRFRPKGFGSTSPLEKKTSHITIILEEKVPGLKAKHGKKEEEKTESKVKEAPEKKEKGKPEIKKEIGKKGVAKVGKKIFQRKAI
jgi:large subunit ribosomal protein L22